MFNSISGYLCNSQCEEMEAIRQVVRSGLYSPKDLLDELVFEKEYDVHSWEGFYSSEQEARRDLVAYKSKVKKIIDAEAAACCTGSRDMGEANGLRSARLGI